MVEDMNWAKKDALNVSCSLTGKAYGVRAVGVYLEQNQELKKTVTKNNFIFFA